MSGKKDSRVLCAPVEVLNRQINRLRKLPGRLGGAAMAKAGRAMPVGSPPPLCLKVAEAMAEALADLVKAQEQTGITPALILGLIKSWGAMTRVERRATRAAERLMRVQFGLAARIRACEERVHQEVQRLVSTLSRDESRELKSDYSGVQAERDGILDERDRQTAKTRRIAKKAAEPLAEFDAQGRFLQTVVALQEGREVSEADLLQAVEHADRIRQADGAHQAPGRRLRR